MGWNLPPGEGAAQAASALGVGRGLRPSSWDLEAVFSMLNHSPHKVSSGGRGRRRENQEGTGWM